MYMCKAVREVYGFRKVCLHEECICMMSICALYMAVRRVPLRRVCIHEKQTYVKDIPV